MNDNKKLPLIIAALYIWMTIILLIQLITFTPPVLTSIASSLNLDKHLINLQGRIEPYFKVIDFDVSMMAEHDG